MCKQSSSDIARERKIGNNDASHTRLERWSWRRQPLQIIDIKDIPEVDFSKWDHEVQLPNQENR
jgi:hypothetical protein